MALITKYNLNESGNNNTVSPSVGSLTGYLTSADTSAAAAAGPRLERPARGRGAACDARPRRARSGRRSSVRRRQPYDRLHRRRLSRATLEGLCPAPAWRGRGAADSDPGVARRDRRAAHGADAR